MAWTPMLMTVGVGLNARWARDTWEFPRASEVHEENVKAYAPLVAQVERMVEKGATVKELEALAREWVRKAEAQEIRPLVPAFYEDTSEEGPKAQIMEARQNLVGALISSAERKMGTPSQRAERLLLAMRLSEAVKYSDFRTVYLCSREQSRAAQLLGRLGDELPRDRAAEVAEALQSFRSRESALSRMTHVARQQYATYKKRTGREPVSIEEAQYAVALVNKIENGAAPVTGRRLNSPLYVSNESRPEYVSALGIAWSAVRVNDATLEKASSALLTPPRS